MRSRSCLSSRFQLGADASVAVGELGAGVGAGTTVQFGEDVYAFARNMGLYGGLALDGTYVMPRDAWNQAFYGQPLTAEQIVSKRRPRGAWAPRRCASCLAASRPVIRPSSARGGAGTGRRACHRRDRAGCGATA